MFKMNEHLSFFVVCFLKRIYFFSILYLFCFSGRTPGQAAEDHPFGAGGRYLPRTSSSSGLGLGGGRRRSTDSRESLASRESVGAGGGGGTASSTLRRERHKSLSRRGSRPRCEAGHPHPQGPRSPRPALSPGVSLYSKKELGLSEPGKTPTQDASDRYAHK